MRLGDVVEGLAGLHAKAAEALVHGVAAERVSAATGGLEPDELAVGLTAWADRQWAAGRMGEREHLAVLGSVGTWMRSAARPRAWL